LGRLYAAGDLGNRLAPEDERHESPSTKEVVMLGDRDAGVTLPVANLGVAKDFYENVLGLRHAGVDAPGGLLYRSGSTLVLVYESEFAGTNKATAATWGVGEELERIVEELKVRGVQFEHYDLPGTTREGDIHSMGAMKAAWFTDPDGNILALVNQEA
jgi:catechol 2,3-dioxygenase-like lactoylglutathione lyase family enzyme